MATLLADVRYGLRLARRHPGFAAAAVLTLALGIGANATMFSVLYAVVLRPLPYPDPGRLYVIDGERDGRSQGAEATSLPDFEDWKRDARGFEAMATGGYWTFNLTGRAVPERILGGRVSGDFFAVLGTPPLLGRALRPEDDRPESPAVAVLGYGLWQRSFGGDPAVLGRTLFLNGVPTTVVGVMPAGFGYPSRAQEIWAPLANELTDVPRDARFLYPIARLARSADLRSAQTSLDVVSSRLAAQFPGTNKGWGARLVPARDALVGDVRPALFVLSGAVS